MAGAFAEGQFGGTPFIPWQGVGNPEVGGGDTGMQSTLGTFPSKSSFIDKAASILPYAAGGLMLAGGLGYLGAGAATGAAGAGAEYGIGEAFGGMAAPEAVAGGAMPASLAGTAFSGAMPPAMTSVPGVHGQQFGPGGMLAAGAMGSEMLFPAISESAISPIEPAGDFGGVADFGGGGVDFANFGGVSPNFSGLSTQDFAGLADSYNVSGLGGEGGWEDWMRKMKGLPWRGIGLGLTAGSGLYGMYQANQMKRLAQQAQDPHTGQYRDQLAALMANPNSVTSMPGYQFGMDQGRLAIQRQGAASGSGGNEAIALARYTPEYAQNFYNAQIKNLAALSQGNPGAQLQGAGMASDLTSRGLASLGYTAFMGGGGKMFPW